jgi:hypothetical protein
MVLGHPIVNVLGLGGDRSGALAFSPVQEEELDEVVPPEKLVSILDGDASQRRCIKAAIDGPELCHGRAARHGQEPDDRQRSGRADLARPDSALRQ